MVSEGTRYKVRNVIIEGNTKLKTEKLREDLELHSGKPFLMAVREADKNRMLIKYSEIGCIDTQIACEPRFTNQLGVVDLVYKIEEGEPYLMGELRINGNGRTKDKVIRREAVMAGLLPGEVLDKNRIEIFQRRLMGLGYFMNDPNQGKQIEIEIANRRPKDKPYGDLMMPLMGEVSQARMQDPGSGADLLPAPESAPAGCGAGDDGRAKCPRADAVRQRPVQPAGECDAAGRCPRASSLDAGSRRTACPPIPARPPSAPASPPARFPASPA